MLLLARTHVFSGAGAIAMDEHPVTPPPAALSRNLQPTLLQLASAVPSRLPLIRAACRSALALDATTAICRCTAGWRAGTARSDRAQIVADPTNIHGNLNSCFQDHNQCTYMKCIFKVREQVFACSSRQLNCAPGHLRVGQPRPEQVSPVVQAAFRR